MSRPYSLDDEGSTKDFSLVMGGPLFQLFRRTGLCGAALELPRRRTLVLCAITWLPLLCLSAFDGRFWGAPINIPFLYDIETHVRFLISLPLLVAAELIVHQRMRSVVAQFIERGLVPDSSRPQFEAAVTLAIRRRNSVFAESLLALIVYGTSAITVWREHIRFGVSGWHGDTASGRLDLTAAGWWFALVSLPLFQFLLLRWYYRLIIWTRFLWSVSRLDLHLIAMHPDRTAGLAFLARVSHAFGPLLFAQGAVVSGTLARRILYGGAQLPEFKTEIIGIVLIMVLFVLGPLLVFGPRLAKVRRDGLREYGILAQRYVHEFDQKWVRSATRPAEPLLGSPDIQSLADLANAYTTIHGMNRIPFSGRAFIQLTLATLAPMAPLALTMVSLDKILISGIKLLL